MPTSSSGLHLHRTQSIEFPVDALPTSIAQFVEEQAQALGVPVDLVALPALVAMATAIGNTHLIKIKKGWTEPAAIYACTIAPPGSLKTPALESALSPILSGSHEFRTWTSDVTIEKLGNLLFTNPRGLLVYRDELVGWVKSLNAYRGGKGSDKQFYMSAWSGAPCRIDRMMGAEIDLPRPFVCVIGSIQPDLLSDLDDTGGKADGFLNRFLFAWPDDQPVGWTDFEVSDGVKTAYETRIADLLQIPFSIAPQELALTPAGLAFWKNWHESHCQEMNDPSCPPFMQYALSKLKGYGARLALIHALGTNPDASEVDVESVAAAAAMVDYFKVQASQVGSALGPAKTSPLARCKEEIRRKLVKCRYVGNKRDLQQRSAFDAPTFNQAIDEMSIPELEITGSDLKLNQ